jgi:hypothetical protein
MAKIAIAQPAKSHDVKTDETKKPVNLRANVMPSDGFVLQIDGKLKTRYDSSEEAVTAGRSLKERYPVIQVAVYDAAERVYTPLQLAE